jgi:hypothetical protein
MYENMREKRPKRKRGKFVLKNGRGEDKYTH